jgi:isocitrate dehydrogenase
VREERAPALPKELVGVDVFFHWRGDKPATLAQHLQLTDGDGLRLTMISNRGLTVWPNAASDAFLADHWRCRFEASTPTGRVTHQQIIRLLSRVADAGYDFIKTENLCTFDGVPGYALGQGQ